MKLLWQLLWRYPSRSAIMLTALLAASIAEGFSLSALLPTVEIALNGTSASGAFGSWVVAALQARGIEPALHLMLLIVVGGVVVKSCLLLVANRQVGYTVAGVASAFRWNYIDALVRSNWEFVTRKRSGALANTVATEAYRAASAFEYAARAVAIALQAVIYTGVALLVSWQATLLALVAGTLLARTLRALLRATHRAGTSQTDLMRRLIGDLNDYLGALKGLKAMRRDAVADEILKTTAADIETATRREVISKEALRALQEPMLAMLAAAGLYLTIRVLALAPAEMMVLVFLLVRILGLFNKLQRQVQLVLAQLPAFESIERETRAAEAAREHRGGATAATMKHAIRLHAVTLGYDDGVVIDNFSATIHAREFNVVVAPSGAGKTTLLDALCGMKRPLSGSIEVDGVPFERLDLDAWRREIGYVPQDPALLNASILANIIAGAPALGEADARDALRRVGLLDYIEQLPRGLDSVVGERGSALSGGQRQRLAIARALVHGPKVLILDEPTSALDLNAANDIALLLRDLARRITVIAASHQPGLIRTADNLVELVPVANTMRRPVQRLTSA